MKTSTKYSFTAHFQWNLRKPMGDLRCMWIRPPATVKDLNVLLKYHRQISLFLSGSFGIHMSLLLCPIYINNEGDCSMRVSPIPFPTVCWLIMKLLDLPKCFLFHLPPFYLTWLNLFLSWCGFLLDVSEQVLLEGVDVTGYKIFEEPKVETSQL